MAGSFLHAAWGERLAAAFTMPAFSGSKLPRLRSGFRLRAQTPAKRLNFDSAPIHLVKDRRWRRCAQDDRGRNGRRVRRDESGHLYLDRFLANERSSHEVRIMRLGNPTVLWHGNCIRGDLPAGPADLAR